MSTAGLKETVNLIALFLGCLIIRQTKFKPINKGKETLSFILSFPEILKWNFRTVILIFTTSNSIPQFYIYILIWPKPWTPGFSFTFVIENFQYPPWTFTSMLETKAKQRT